MERRAKQRLSFAVAGVDGASARQLAPVSASERTTQMAKTNPRPLSSRQLAAARLLASGVAPTEVAQQLGMSRGGC